MKEISPWKTLLGIVFVFIVGCGSSDNPVGEEISETPVEPPMQIVSPILGDWHLQDVTWLKDGVATGQLEFTLFSITLTLDPDRIFEIVVRYPIEIFANSFIREQNGWQHIQEIVVTHRGKFYIVENRLQLNLMATSVKPVEAPDIDSNFENPIFWYYVEQSRGPLDYAITDDGKELELRRQEGRYTMKYFHRRPNNE